MLARLLGNWLAIRPNEQDGVLYFFLILLVFSFGASFARSIGMTLLVEEVGGENLPVMFIFIDLAVMIGSLLYAHYTEKFSGLAIFGFFLLSTTLFSLIVQLLFFVTAYWSPQSNWVYGFFFVGFFFFYVLISIHAGSVVASYFTAVQVKRVTPVINAGMPIGGALGGTSLIIFLNVFHFKPEQLITVLGVACLCAFGLLRLVNARLSPVRTGNNAPVKSQKNPLIELMEAFKYIIGSKLMIYMSLGLIFFVIANKLLDYQYQTIIYPTVYKIPTERATFFATYDVFANIAWLLVQLTFTSRLVMKWGVGASNLLYPALSAIVALALFIYFYFKAQDLFEGSMTIMLILGILTQFVNQEMRGALRTPTNNLLFNAIPANQWGINKAFLNGIVFPLSTVTVATFILITRLGADNTSSSFLTTEQLYYLLPLIALVVSLLGILVALPQWAAYDEGVFGLLNRELFDRRIEVKIGGRGNNSLKQVIDQKLNSPDPYHVIAALEMVRVLRLNYFVSHVGNLLLRSLDFKIKEHCISTLAALPQSHSSLTYLVEALRTEKNPEVLPLILKNLGQFKSVNFNDVIDKLLTHPTPKVFIEACLCLHKHPSYRHKQLIETKIIGRLHNPESPDTALYLSALGELRQSHYSKLVLPFFESENAEIRLAAFTAFIRMLEGQLESHKSLLIQALDSHDKNMKIAALRALKECQSLDDWSPIIRLLGVKDRTLVTESKELLRLSLGVCKSALLEQVFSDKISVQQRFEILSLIYSKLNDEQRAQLQKGADEALKNFVQVNGLLKLHEVIGPTSRTYDLVTKVLQEIAQDHLHHVLTIITFVSEQNVEFFHRVSRGLQSLSRANQGNALEVLSNAKEKYLVNRVLKYFDERLNDLKAVNRIHIALFNESLKINKKEYNQQLLALDNDMLKACLLYIKQERHGVLKGGELSKNILELLS